jgi:hypothetical protein
MKTILLLAKQQRVHVSTDCLVVVQLKCYISNDRYQSSIMAENIPRVIKHCYIDINQHQSDSDEVCMSYKENKI